MSLDFPASPTVGLKYPQPPVAGQPVYSWDGEKWTSQGSQVGGKTPIFTDGSTAMTAPLTLVNPPVLSNDAAAKAYVDLGVRADFAQALTATQQTQARQNVYAAPFDAMAYSGMQINGSMEVSQELGTTGRTTNGYVCDGWQTSKTGTMAFASGAATNPTVFPGFPYFFYTNITTAQASLGVGDYTVSLQLIEGWRIARLAWGTASAQPITVGFWSMHHRTGTYGGIIRNGGSTRSYAFTYTHNVADVPQYNVVTIPGDTTGTWAVDSGIGLQIIFTMACGATFTAPSANAWLAGNYLAAPGQVNAVAATSDVFRITGVTVLPGSEAPSAARSPFIMRPFDQELVTCQRYWQKSYPYASPAGTLAAGGALSLVLFGTTGTGNLAGMTEHFVVSMRAAPTITAYSQRTGASGMISDDYAAADTPATINLISEKRFRWYGATIAPNLVNFTMQFVADARL